MEYTSDCRRCQALYQELSVVTEQLREAKAVLRALEADKQNWQTKRTIDSDRIEGATSIDRIQNSGSFPFRYVPPHEFLPELFVSQNLDLLIIIDKYAQLFHRYHIGSRRFLDSSKALGDAERSALTSANTLLDLKVGKLRTEMDALLKENARLQIESLQIVKAAEDPIPPTFSVPERVLSSDVDSTTDARPTPISRGQSFPIAPRNVLSTSPPTIDRVEKFRQRRRALPDHEPPSAGRRRAQTVIVGEPTRSGAGLENRPTNRALEPWGRIMENVYSRRRVSDQARKSSIL